MDFLCVLVLFPLSVGAVSPDVIITAERGQNVSLTCGAPHLHGGGVLEWRRVDLKEYVFRVRPLVRPLDSDLQHPSFRDRVSPAEDRDPSVVLENVQIKDSGTYWCRVLQGDGTRPDSGPISTVQLLVVPELELIQAESGQSVTLPCHAPQVDPQVSITWSRHDLDPQEVLLIRGGMVQSQHPSFRNRLEVGRQAELGDVSVTLKNVTPEDSGTYECRVVRRSAARRRRSASHPHPISSVHLSVSPADASSAHKGGTEDGLPLALTAGAFAAGVALGAAAAVLTVVLRRSRKQSGIPGLQRECAVV